MLFDAWPDHVSTDCCVKCDMQSRSTKAQPHWPSGVATEVKTRNTSHTDDGCGSPQWFQNNGCCSCDAETRSNLLSTVCNERHDNESSKDHPLTALGRGAFMEEQTRASVCRQKQTIHVRKERHASQNGECMPSASAKFLSLPQGTMAKSRTPVI